MYYSYRTAITGFQPVAQPNLYLQQMDDKSNKTTRQSISLKNTIVTTLICLILIQDNQTYQWLQLLISIYFLFARKNMLIDGFLILLWIVLLIQNTPIFTILFRLLTESTLFYHLQKYREDKPSESGPPNQLRQSAQNSEYQINPIETCLMDSFPVRLHTLPSYTFLLQQFQKRKCFLGDTSQKFLRAISNNYNRVPYHNITHGLCVAHTLNKYLAKMEKDLKLTDIQYCAMLIAAYCHDVGHQGKSNNYYTKKGHPLADMYFDSGILEHYHCSVTFRVARKYDIFGLVPQKERGSVRKLVVRCILATDMANHHDHVRQLKLIQKKTEYTKDERQLIEEQLVHASDISTNAMPFEISERWRKRIYEQFHEEECQLSGQVRPMPTEREQHSNTIGFINTFCLPMFKELHRLHQDFKEAVDTLQKNKKRRQELM